MMMKNMILNVKKIVGADLKCVEYFKLRLQCRLLMSYKRVLNQTQIYEQLHSNNT